MEMLEHQQPLIAWSIASYRDSQLLPTLQSGIYQAHFASRLLPVVCWQGDLESPCCSCALKSCCLGFPGVPLSEQHNQDLHISTATSAAPTFFAYTTRPHSHARDQPNTQCAASTSPAAAVGCPAPPLYIVDAAGVLPASSAAAAALASPGSSAATHDAAACTARLPDDSRTPSPHRSSGVSFPLSRASQSHVSKKKTDSQHFFQDSYADGSATGASCACWCHALSAVPHSGRRAAVLQGQQQNSLFNDFTWHARTKKNIQQRNKCQEGRGIGKSKAPPLTSAHRQCSGDGGSAAAETGQLTAEQRAAARDEEQEQTREQRTATNPAAALSAAATPAAAAAQDATAPRSAAASPGAAGFSAGAASPDAAAFPAAAASRDAGGEPNLGLRGETTGAVAAADMYDETEGVGEVASVTVARELLGISRARRRCASVSDARKTEMSGESQRRRSFKVLPAGSNLSRETTHISGASSSDGDSREDTVTRHCLIATLGCLARQQSCSAGAGASSRKGDPARPVKTGDNIEEALRVIEREERDAGPNDGQEEVAFVNRESFSLLEVYAACWAKPCAQQQQTKRVRSASSTRRPSGREGLTCCIHRDPPNSWNDCSKNGDSADGCCAEGGYGQVCRSSYSKRRVNDRNSKSCRSNRRNSSFSYPRGNIEISSRGVVTDASCPGRTDRNKALLRRRSGRCSKTCSKRCLYIRTTRGGSSVASIQPPCAIETSPPSSFWAAPAAAATSAARSSSTLLPRGVDSLPVENASVCCLRASNCHSSGWAPPAAPGRTSPSSTFAAAADKGLVLHHASGKSIDAPRVGGASGSTGGDYAAETAVTLLQDVPLETLQHLLPAWVQQQLFVPTEEDGGHKNSRSSTLLCAEPRVTARFHLLSLLLPPTPLTGSGRSRTGDIEERQQNIDISSADTTCGSRQQQYDFRGLLSESNFCVCRSKECYCNCSYSAGRKADSTSSQNSSSSCTCGEKTSIRSSCSCTNSSIHGCQDGEEFNCLPSHSSGACYSRDPSGSRCRPGSSSCSKENSCGSSSSPCTAGCMEETVFSSRRSGHADGKLPNSIRSARCCHPSSENSSSSLYSKGGSLEGSRRDTNANTYVLHTLNTKGKRPLQLAVMDMEGPCTTEGIESATAETLRLRFVFLDWRSSRGPCFARYICEQVLPFITSSTCADRGEPLLLQTDSHMRFAPHYDCFLVRQLFLAAAAAQQHRLKTSPIEYADAAAAVFPASSPPERHRCSSSPSGGTEATEVAATACEAEHSAASTTEGGREEGAAQASAAIPSEDEKKTWREDQTLPTERSLRCALAFQKHKAATTKEKRREEAAEKELAAEKGRAASAREEVDEGRAAAKSHIFARQVQSAKMCQLASLYRQQHWRSYPYKNNILYWDGCMTCGSCCDCMCSSCSCCCIRLQQKVIRWESLKKDSYRLKKQLPRTPRGQGRQKKFKWLFCSRVQSLLQPLRLYSMLEFLMKTPERQVSPSKKSFSFAMDNKRKKLREGKRHAVKQQRQLIQFCRLRLLRKRHQAQIPSLPRVLLTAYPPGYDEAMPFYKWPESLIRVEGAAGSSRQHATHVEAPAGEHVKNREHQVAAGSTDAGGTTARDTAAEGTAAGDTAARDTAAGDTAGVTRVCTSPNYYRGRLSLGTAVVEAAASPREDLEQQPCHVHAECVSQASRRHAFAAVPVPLQRLEQVSLSTAGPASSCRHRLLPPVLLCAARFDEKGILRTTGRVLLQVPEATCGGRDQLLLHAGQLSPPMRRRQAEEIHQRDTYRGWRQQKDFRQHHQREEEVLGEAESAQQQELLQPQSGKQEPEEQQQQQPDVQKHEKQRAEVRGSKSPLLKKTSILGLLTEGKGKDVIKKKKSETCWLPDAVSLIDLQQNPLREQEAPEQQSCCCCCDKRVQQKTGDAEEKESFHSVRPSLFWAAGFSFGPARVAKEVGYDFQLPFVFFGEEIVMAMRLFTHGWQFFSPAASVVFHLWTRRHRPFFRQDIHQLHLNTSSSSNRGNSSSSSNSSNNSSNSNSSNSSRSNNSDSNSSSSNSSGNSSDRDNNFSSSDNNPSSRGSNPASSDSSSRRHTCTRNNGTNCLSHTNPRVGQESEWRNRYQSRNFVRSLEEEQQSDSAILPLKKFQSSTSSDSTPQQEGSVSGRWRIKGDTSQQQCNTLRCTGPKYVMATPYRISARMQESTTASNSMWMSRASSESQDICRAATEEAAPAVEERKAQHSVASEDAGSPWKGRESIYAIRQQSRREASTAKFLLPLENSLKHRKENVSCTELSGRQEIEKGSVPSDAVQQQREARLSRREEQRYTEQVGSHEGYRSGEVGMPAAEDPETLVCIEKGSERRRKDVESASQEERRKTKQETSLAESASCSCSMCNNRAAAELRMQSIFAASSRVLSHHELQRLGFGDKRCPQDFWKRAGIDWHSRRISLRALRGGMTHDEAFEGAGPTAAAALNLVLQLLKKTPVPREQ